MSTGLLGQVVKLLGARSATSDEQLLEEMTTSGSETALMALMHRHGPLVLGVCRNVLGDLHEAEDAFQATFIVLFKKAASLDRQRSLAPWLHTVAYRTARRAQRQLLESRGRERKLEDMPQAEAVSSFERRELRSILNEELSRLPTRYAAPVILCYLEGKSHEEATRELGWPLGSIAYRLTRGLALLRQRLTQRGIVLSASLLGTLLTESRSPAVTRELLTATGHTLVALAAGQAAATDGASAAVLLAEDVLRSMASGPRKLVIALSVIIGLLGLGTGSLICAILLATLPGPSSPEGEPAALVLGENGLPVGALLRLGNAGMNHAGPAWSVVCAPDGKTLASAGEDGLRLWAADTNGLIVKPAGHQGAVYGVAYAPDSRTFASAGHDGTVRLWSSDTGKPIRTLRGHEGPVAYVAYAPDGKIVASAGFDRTVRLWEADTGQALRTIAGHREAVLSVSFAPDGQTIASAGDDGFIRLWAVATGKLIHRIEDNQKLVGNTRVRYAPDGKTLASTGPGYTVQLWDPATGKLIRRLPKQEHTINTMNYSRDGRTLVTAGNGGEICFWEADTGKLLRRVNETWTVGFQSVCYASDERTLALARVDGGIQFLEVATGKSIGTGGHQGRVSAVSYAPDGLTVATAGCDDTSVQLWDARTGKFIRRIDVGPQQMLRDVRYAPDGRTLASASEFVQLWDPSTGQRVRKFPGETNGVNAISYAPDSRALATAGWTGAVQVRATTTGGLVRKIDAHQEQQARSVSYSPDGRILASAGDTGALRRGVRLWDVATGKLIRDLQSITAQQGLIESVSYAPDGRTIATTGVEVPGQQPGMENGGQEYTAGTVWLWDATTGSLLRKWTGHRGAVNTATYSPNCRLLASAGDDGSVRLWETATGQLVCEFRGHAGKVHGVSYAPDGRTVVSAGDHATVLIWDVAGWGQRQPPPTKVTDMDLQRLWQTLAGDDAVKAHRAIWTMTAAADQATEFFSERLKPVTAPTAERLSQLVADLDSKQFATRQQASEELQRLGVLAREALRRKLADQPALEVRQRVEQLLAKLENQAIAPETMRQIRAIETLEHIGTPAATQVLERLAEGAPGHRLAEEAKAALQRLAKRPAAID